MIPTHDFEALSLIIYVEAPIVDSRGRNEVPQIHPLVEHRTHHEPVSDVQFLEHFLVTCSWGKVKFWARPTDSPTDITPPVFPVTTPGTTPSYVSTTSTASVHTTTPPAAVLSTPP